MGRNDGIFNGCRSLDDMDWLFDFRRAVRRTVSALSARHGEFDCIRRKFLEFVWLFRPLLRRRHRNAPGLQREFSRNGSELLQIYIFGLEQTEVCSRAFCDYADKRVLCLNVQRLHEFRDRTSAPRHDFGGKVLSINVQRLYEPDGGASSSRNDHGGLLLWFDV